MTLCEVNLKEEMEKRHKYSVSNLSFPYICSDDENDATDACDGGSDGVDDMLMLFARMMLLIIMLIMINMMTWIM